MDGDGDLDVVTANHIGDGTFSVRFNDGSGVFSGSSNYAVGSYPYDVALGDLDGDGDLDVVTSNIGDATFSVRFNDYLSGTNGPCCGDDGASDDFSNSTHQCVNGVFSAI